MPENFYAHDSLDCMSTIVLLNAVKMLLTGQFPGQAVCCSLGRLVPIVKCVPSTHRLLLQKCITVRGVAEFFLFMATDCSKTFDLNLDQYDL